MDLQMLQISQMGHDFSSINPSDGENNRITNLACQELVQLCIPDNSCTALPNKLLELNKSQRRNNKWLQNIRAPM
jgi:hypothetical protein